jgi:hypothetical protein
MGTAERSPGSPRSSSPLDFTYCPDRAYPYTGLGRPRNKGPATGGSVHESSRGVKGERSTDDDEDCATDPIHRAAGERREDLDIAYEQAFIRSARSIQQLSNDVTTPVIHNCFRLPCRFRNVNSPLVGRITELDSQSQSALELPFSIPPIESDRCLIDCLTSCPESESLSSLDRKIGLLTP